MKKQSENVRICRQFGATTVLTVLAVIHVPPAILISALVGAGTLSTLLSYYLLAVGVVYVLSILAFLYVAKSLGMQAARAHAWHEARRWMRLTSPR